MKTKSVLYAAVGAPVVAARKVSGKVTDQYGALKTKVGEEKANYTEIAQKAIEDWAEEGEKVVSNVQDKKVVEEISAKVDLDQAKEQVSKLRDQLEDMLATWKHSFRPEKKDASEAKGEQEAPAGDVPAEEPAAESSAAKSKAADESSVESDATVAAISEADEAPEVSETAEASQTS